MQERTWAVVMAGGRGTRFWPRSRKSLPKQCLALTSDRTLIQETVDRIRPVVPPERVLVVTGPDMADTIRAQLPELPAGNVLVEPSGRNTAPCIGWAAVEIERRGGGAMVVLPSDHRITDPESFCDVVRAALVAASSSGHLVLLGQTPDRPHTGYGYLAMGPVARSELGLPFHRVDRFIEKPSAERAAVLLEQGGVLWNGGMFVWTTEAILRAFERHMPRSYAALRAIAGGASVSERWLDLEATSIDYGVLEREADGLLAVPCAFGWSDLGSWEAMADVFPAGPLGHAQVAGGVAVDGGGHVVYAPDKVVATVGVDGLIIVDTGDVLLVARRSAAERLGVVLQRLEADGLGRLL